MLGLDVSKVRQARRWEQWEQSRSAFREQPAVGTARVRAFLSFKSGRDHGLLLRSAFVPELRRASMRSLPTVKVINKKMEKF